MKRILSISLAFLLLTAGLHLTVASHYCSGHLAEVKWSFNHALAGCGMEGDHEVAKGVQLEQPCCQDQLSSYAVDGQYQFRSLEFRKFTPSVIACFIQPTIQPFKSHLPADELYTPVFPPGETTPTQVFLEDICVFLI